MSFFSNLVNTVKKDVGGAEHAIGGFFGGLINGAGQAQNRLSQIAEFPKPPPAITTQNRSGGYVGNEPAALIDPRSNNYAGFARGAIEQGVGSGSPVNVLNRAATNQPVAPGVQASPLTGVAQALSQALAHQPVTVQNLGGFLKNVGTQHNVPVLGSALRGVGNSLANSRPMADALSDPNTNQVQKDLAVANIVATDSGGFGGKSLAEELAKTSGVQEVKNLLDKTGTNVSQAIISKIAKSTKPKEIQGLLDSVGKITEEQFNKIIGSVPGTKVGEPVPTTLPEAIKDFVPPVASTENKAAKTILSKGTLIQRQGEAGQKLYDLANSTIERQQGLVKQATDSIPTVLSVNKNNALRNNFIDTVEGNAAPVNAKVQQAVAEWQAFTKDFRNQGVAAKLNIGDLGDKYFPHKIDYQAITKDVNKYNAAINHMLSTGQAATKEEAVRIIQDAKGAQGQARRFGNFEAHRSADLPEFDRGKNVIPSYIEGGARRIAQAEAFGPDNGVAHGLIGDIAKSGYDAETAAKAFDQFVNVTPSSKALRQVRGGLSAARLGLTAVTHAAQTANTAVEGGIGRTLRGYAGLLSKDERAFIDKSNVLGEAKRIKTQEGFEGVAGKVTAPGLNTVMKFNRAVSALVGKYKAESLASKGDEAGLRKLGVTGEIGKTLTEEQKVQAARSLTRDTQFRSTPLDTPLNAETNTGKTVGQFRMGFGYKQTGFVYDKILKEARNGNFAPAIRAGLLFPVAGLGVIKAKDTIKNGVASGLAAATGQPAPEPKNSISSNPAIAALQGANQAGAFGIPGELVNNFQFVKNSQGQVDSTKLIQALASAIAPGAGTAVDVTNRVAQAINGNPQNLEKFGIGLTPVVGTQLANAALPYTPKTKTSGGKRGRPRGSTKGTRSVKGRIGGVGKVSKGSRGTRARKGTGRIKSVRVSTKSRAIKALKV